MYLAWIACVLTAWCAHCLQSDHEKYVKRAGDVEAAAKGPEQAAASEAATLYKKQDLSLKEGETIK